jgi:hypothetical protein
LLKFRKTRCSGVLPNSFAMLTSTSKGLSVYLVLELYVFISLLASLNSA